jgi:BlaI family penicillinase repressor
MSNRNEKHFTRREEQIMDILFQRGEASVSDLMELLPEAPTAGAVRRMLNLLYAKGAVKYRHDGAKKVYRAAVRKMRAGTKALSHVVETFFGGSAANAMAALFQNETLKLTESEKETLSDLIEKAKERGR